MKQEQQPEATTISVIGLGYIGLPTASLLATKGYRVQGCDMSQTVVDTINRGEIHIVERDLDILVRSAVHSGNLSATTTPKAADIFILAVPTPFKQEHAPDLSYVESATRAIAPLLAPGNLVILESTSPMCTTEQIAKWLHELRPDLSLPLGRGEAEAPHHQERIYIAHCPERVLPGQILRELVDNDRIIGGLDAISAEKAKTFYATFVNGEIILTDSRTAEMAKLVENAYRDVNIAFANELSMICDEKEINVWELIRIANRHPRVNILQPGPGVGGHCIAVDPWFIVHSAPKLSPLIRTAREVNDHKADHVVQRVKRQADRFKAPVIACLGLSYKANVDDLRESPAVKIVADLAKEQFGQLLIVEPHIAALPKSLANFSHVHLQDLASAVADADLVVLLVDHEDFAQVSPHQLAEKMVIDTRGVWA